MIIKKGYTFERSSSYIDWFHEQDKKSQSQITKRLASIKLDGHFGDHKFLEEDIWELKWLNGRRVYYAYIEELNIILLLGGNKNGQDQDITQSKKIFKKRIIKKK